MHSHNSFVVKAVVRIAWFVTAVAALNVGLLVAFGGRFDLFSYLPFLSHEILQYIIGACGLISLIALGVSFACACASCGNCPCFGNCSCNNNKMVR